ncbi:hypothetical protein LSTR_LSTR016073 [Laodelphax striatellus]|uniref:Uncharacterized protein n=1 Tax=Laodelphax striatellus TaxID=195883 RepID=A0A482X0W7_LAOST|nr:hypothetical protein LSTR_LSTR003713 [Laodelphax striatellus]RZF47007.1 hypothetical protein LSTR_LSTR016073 [Laodelphax striatellus]
MVTSTYVMSFHYRHNYVLQTRKLSPLLRFLFSKPCSQRSSLDNYVGSRPDLHALGNLLLLFTQPLSLQAGQRGKIKRQLLQLKESVEQIYLVTSKWEEALKGRKEKAVEGRETVGDLVLPPIKSKHIFISETTALYASLV